MPYTPPSPSLASSSPHSDAVKPTEGSLWTPKPACARPATSTSYLHRHRRSPTVTRPNASPNAVLDSVDYFARLDGVRSLRRHSESEASDTRDCVRQSPPPVTNSFMPAGAIVSPPDSANNSNGSSDDEENVRGRQVDHFAELTAAIQIMSHPRSGSPHRHWDNDVENGGPVLPPAKGSLKLALDTRRPPLSKGAHRGSAESGLAYSNMVTGGSHACDESDDECYRNKMPMVRKKSGELVRPALRPPSRRRPSSMPGTPTYSKAVHFDSNLEHVRHFLQVDKPTAVSAGSSPVDVYDHDAEYPFGADSLARRRSSVEWDIKLANFPAASLDRSALPVRVERVFLSRDYSNLVGVIAVSNLSFEKHVAVRFTLDFWKTTSEVVAEYTQDVRRKDANDGCDRFNFSIRLADQANLETKTLFFCVRYNVNSFEFWDNNFSMNYQVDFLKKQKPPTPVGSRPVPLPRSRPNPSTCARPRSMPVAFDDFARAFDGFLEAGSASPNFEDAPIRLKKPLSSEDLFAKPPTRRTAHGQNLSYRYDFGASLSAAMQAIGGSDRGGVEGEIDAAFAKTSRSTTFGLKAETMKPEAVESAKPVALTKKPSIQSTSYHELLDKYCFFGSPKPCKSTGPKLHQVDGIDESPSLYERRAARSAANLVERDRARPGVAAASAMSPFPKAGSDFGLSGPVSYVFPYQSMEPGFFDSPTPTAIRG